VAPRTLRVNPNSSVNYRKPRINVGKERAGKPIPAIEERGFEVGRLGPDGHAMLGGDAEPARAGGELDGRVQEPLGDRLHHGREHVTRRDDGLHPFAEPRQHPGRVVAGRRT
jgi:hypothetical protein